MTTDAFMSSVDAWVDAAKAQGRAVVMETIRELIRVTWDRTPVDSTLLRGSWFASLDSVPSGKGQMQRDSRAEAEVAIRALQPGQVFVFGNSAPYAMRLEYGFVGVDVIGRSYNQSGRYFVRSVVLDAPVIGEGVAARMAGGAMS